MIKIAKASNGFGQPHPEIPDPKRKTEQRTKGGL
jgi:hypothetical protein